MFLGSIWSQGVGQRLHLYPFIQWDHTATLLSALFTYYFLVLSLPPPFCSPSSYLHHTPWHPHLLHCPRPVWADLDSPVAAHASPTPSILARPPGEGWWVGAIVFAFVAELRARTSRVENLSDSKLSRVAIICHLLPPTQVGQGAQHWAPFDLEQRSSPFFPFCLVAERIFLPPCMTTLISMDSKTPRW